jgi:hypothetical protein
VQSHLGWRWTAWITLIMAASFGTLAFFTVPETFAPVILQARAKKIRFETKNWAVHSVQDEKRVDLMTILNIYLLRPIKMLFTEPILVLMTIYMALVYGILYLFFEAYPIAFSVNRGWSPLKGSLPFLSIIVGVVLGSSIIIYMTKTRFARKMKKHGRVIPEERLPPMMIGAVLFPIGLFWFAWTSSAHISPWPQIIAGVPLGAGILIIFMQGLNYSKYQDKKKDLSTSPSPFWIKKTPWSHSLIFDSHRRISDVCEQRHCRQYAHQVFPGRRIPHVCHGNVQQAGPGLGDESPGLSLGGHDSRPRPVLHIRPQDSRLVQDERKQDVGCSWGLQAKRLCTGVCVEICFGFHLLSIASIASGNIARRLEKRLSGILPPRRVPWDGIGIMR